jgi:Diacylglycerol kinase catalytic domain
MTSRPAKSVLIINPRSGGGKAARFDLVAHCRARGIDPILFEPGDDLTTLATAAVRAGADAVGMAGGDGSQAAVAAVAPGTTSPSTSASTATTSSARSTRSATGMNGASILAASTAAPS